MNRAAPLFWRLFLANTIVMLVAIAILTLSPITISSPPNPGEWSVILIGLTILIVANAVILRHGLDPLSDLADAIGDLGSDGLPDRIPVRGAPEIAAVAVAHNRLLDQLEVERIAAARVAVRAQESERLRISRELHDDVGQTLTFLLLRLSDLRGRLSRTEAEQAGEIADVARGALDEIRALSRRLVPSSLLDLGLEPTLRSLASATEQASGVRIEVSVESGLEPQHERDLVVFRVAQESLTNVVKHAAADSAYVTVRQDADSVHLVVADDGSGSSGPDGIGTYSMRERASLVGGRVDREATPGRGTTVTLTLPRVLGEGTAGVRPRRPIPLPSLPETTS